MLQKLELSASLMGLLARMQTFPFLPLTYRVFGERMEVGDCFPNVYGILSLLALLVSLFTSKGHKKLCLMDGSGKSKGMPLPPLLTDY